MLYVHSGSPIEEALYKELQSQYALAAFRIQDIHKGCEMQLINLGGKSKTLLYSFQHFRFYKHLNTFREECDKVRLLLEYIKSKRFERIILISYPGAYSNSDNLYLQHKGIIEQMMVGSKLACTLLRVQGIGNAVCQMNNLQELFFDCSKQQFILPKSVHAIAYSINIRDLALIILKAVKEEHSGQFDIFDRVSSLSDFLQYHSAASNKRVYTPLYLYARSFFGMYISPTMMELFTRPTVPMYNFRAEKEFSMALNSEIFGILREKEKYTGPPNFMWSHKECLVPVS